MTSGYTLYVDESGDSATTNIRSDASGGASQFMVLGGVLIADDLKEQCAESLSQICDHLGVNQLHCKKLNHHKQVYYARQVSNLDLTWFGVISNKKTLDNFPQIKEQEAFRYYHKCVQYLLEQLCKYIQEKGIDPNHVSIVFEETGALQIPKLKGLIFWCIHKSFRKESQILEILNTSRFNKKKKKDEPLLQFADLAANSLYQCVNKSQSNFQIPETRYVNELKGRFWGESKGGGVINYGIRPIHNIGNLRLDRDVKEFFQGLKNTP